MDGLLARHLNFSSNKTQDAGISELYPFHDSDDVVRKRGSNNQLPSEFDKLQKLSPLFDQGHDFDDYFPCNKNTTTSLRKPHLKSSY